MDQFGNLNDFRRECIDAKKVFDFVIVSLPGNQAGLEFIPANGTDVDDICEALDMGGKIVNVQAEVIIPEDGGCEADMSSPRTDEEVVLDNGEVITLQWVTVTKDMVTFRVTFDVVDENGCVVVAACGTAEIDDIEPENVLLCAPEGTMIDCTLLPTTTIKPFNFTCNGSEEEGDVLTFSARFNLCQAIQSYDFVKLEVLARLCEPRDIILPEETCAPLLPQQCPQIFPGPRSMGNNNE
ncbi:hypothetical protein GLW08_16200 [Pontibacillus yanchengensis]|uniref:Uncharacterized protein n=2 Tax=Pontibacillus yanchengensis TaxID=462910 RepID=A0ACC7VJL1_9BACI|nr:hypothetical protein [Pontibacillus yanchengensis]MYL35267.1 hypothetical protein [Pontibacillus yanchengensis]MYL54877.1 hypothetical protein [Pontibacillus yanchengensis]